MRNLEVFTIIKINIAFKSLRLKQNYIQLEIPILAFSSCLITCTDLQFYNIRMEKSKRIFQLNAYRIEYAICAAILHSRTRPISLNDYAGNVKAFVWLEINMTRWSKQQVTGGPVGNKLALTNWVVPCESYGNLVGSGRRRAAGAGCCCMDDPHVYELQWRRADSWQRHPLHWPCDSACRWFYICKYP